MEDIIVIGAGPAGLSCAIEATKAGLKCIVLEKGSLVDSIRRFPTNMVWFSTPELLEIGEIPFVISTVRPTRIDALSYYQKVARHYKIECRYFDGVRTVGREDGFFTVVTESGKRYVSRYVIVATGYFDHPNRLDIPGETLPHVFHYYSEPFPEFDREVVVVGGRNSAVEAALDLYRHGARVTLIHRGPRLSDGVKYWILPDIENRIKSGEIKALFSSSVKEAHREGLLVETPEGTKDLRADAIFVLIGFQPDVAHLRSYGVMIDPNTLAPTAEEKTLETNVPGLYVAGSVVAGKNNNKIFIENGRAHGAIIVGSIRSKKE